MAIKLTKASRENSNDIAPMYDSLPLSIDLSPTVREILDLIIQDQQLMQGPTEPERTVLLWAKGASETATAKDLNLTEEEVRLLRHRWWLATARIRTAEKRTHKAFNDLFSLIFRIPNENISPAEPLKSSVSGPQNFGNNLSAGKSSSVKELRPTTRALIEILHHKPKVYGINRSNWNQESLAEVFGTLYGQRPSKSWVSRQLNEAGLTWKKSHRVLTSPDPEYREKVDVLLNTLRSLKVDEDLFFVDELGPLQVKRYGGRSYTVKGVTPTHPQTQPSKGSITLYGALSALTNQVTWFYGKTKDSAGIIDLTEILFNQYQSKSKIYLTWDAASWHGSDELVQWVDRHNEWTTANSIGPIIEFVPLPSSAQFLDVIEAVFSGMKRAVIHNSDYQSEEEMKDAISTHFRERNEHFKQNPKRAGKKIWEIDFFQDHEHIRSGNYREW